MKHLSDKTEAQQALFEQIKLNRANQLNMKKKVEADRAKFLMKLERNSSKSRKETPIFRSKQRPDKNYEDTTPVWKINTFHQAPIDDIGFKVKYIGTPT